MTVRFERTSGGGTLIVLRQPPGPSKMGPKALDAILKPLLAKRFAR